MSDSTDKQETTAADVEDGETLRRGHLTHGTAFVTPEGVVGVIGYERVSGLTSRPLEYADFAALQTFAGEVRKETASR